MTTTAKAPAAASGSSDLRRSIGFWGLMFISLGSIIGSGWLLGALTAATVAGPASLISWVIGAFLLVVLALIFAELGGRYPVAGGTARFPYFAFGTLAGFTAGWAAYLSSVATAPIEVEASISYLGSTHWAQQNLHLLHDNGTLTGVGLLFATGGMLFFTIINLLGAKLLAESNTIMVIWKFAVPVLTIAVVMILRFEISNFTAGGGFAPYGVHGIFAALPAGVVFALMGFEQATQMAGEARNPRRDVSRAIIVSMMIGVALYILLQVALIGALNPANLVSGWASPIGVGDYGPYYTIALGLGATWLAWILLSDAIISPMGTGLVYLGASARLSYALGEEETLPDSLTRTNKRGVPVYSILLAFVIGELAFLPFPSWAALVSIVTGAGAIMYGFGPVALAALQKLDPDRFCPYRMPWPWLLNPIGFIAANLIIYWSGFESTWKLLTAIFVGRLLFEYRLRRADRSRADIDWRAASWVWPWLIGMTIIGVMGDYGTGALHILPNWIDLIVVILFSLLIFYSAVRVAISSETAQALIAKQPGEPGEPGESGEPGEPVKAGT